MERLRRRKMQAQQVLESEIIPLVRGSETGAMRAEPAAISSAITTIENPFPEDVAAGGIAGNEFDRAIGSVRTLIVQLDNRIAHAKRSVQELEQVRARLV